MTALAFLGWGVAAVLGVLLRGHQHEASWWRMIVEARDVRIERLQEALIRIRDGGPSANVDACQWCGVEGRKHLVGTGTRNGAIDCPAIVAWRTLRDDK